MAEKAAANERTDEIPHAGAVDLFHFMNTRLDATRRKVMAVPAFHKFAGTILRPRLVLWLSPRL